MDPSEIGKKYDLLKQNPCLIPGRDNGSSNPNTHVKEA